MIEVNNLTVKYKDFTAVDSISFDVKKGEIFGIIGPNGAGKTSTIECLEGLKKLSGGEVAVMGINPVNRRKLYEYIGVQLQEASFPDAIKVKELCQLFSSFYKKPADYNALLERFDLYDKKNAYVKKLSGGQRQKISVVVALIANPEIIFLDELTTGLDPQARIDMWELIKSLRDEGKTVLMTTHFMEEAEYLCDRVCLMVKSRIAAIGTVRQLVEQAEISQKISFTSRKTNKEALEGIPGISHVTENNGTFNLYGDGKNLERDVVVFITEHNLDFENLSSTKPRLEDVFLKITGYKMGETK